VQTVQGAGGGAFLRAQPVQHDSLPGSMHHHHRWASYTERN